MEPSINIHPSALLGVGNCLFRHRSQEDTEPVVGLFWGTRGLDNVIDIRDVSELKTTLGCQIDKEYLQHVVSLHAIIHPNDQFIGLFIATELTEDKTLSFDAIAAASSLTQANDFMDLNLLIGSFEVKKSISSRYFLAGAEISPNRVRNVFTNPERSVLSSMSTASSHESSFEVVTRSLLSQIRCLKELYDELDVLTSALGSGSCEEGKNNLLYSEISATLQSLNRPDILVSSKEDRGYMFDLCSSIDELMNSTIQNEAVLL